LHFTGSDTQAIHRSLH